MTTIFTSASANKHLRHLKEEKTRILADEKETCTYVRAIGENEDPPVYDYALTRAEVAKIDREAMALRHALHRFNASTMLPNCGITIDEALVRMARLTAEVDRLSLLRRTKAKERNSKGRYFGSDSNLIEYTYANFDVNQADEDYRRAIKQLTELQLELDLVNQTQTFDVEI